MNSSQGRAKLSGQTWALIGLAGLAIIVGGFIISTLTPSLLPTQASAESEPIDGLFRFMLFLGGIVFLLVQGLLVFTIIKFRRKPGDTGDGAAFNGNTTLEIVWTAIPAVIIVVLALYSYNVWVTITEPKANELVVQTVGQRFTWSFTYEDPLERIPADMQQTFSDPVLHTYVGRPVVLQMQTRDVNHAFWVPSMRIKQDLLAGRVTDVRFTPTEAGRYRIVCAELCGGGHGGMYSYIQVYATEQEWLQRFIDIRIDQILNPSTDPIVVGEQILRNGSTVTGASYPCAGCHANDNLSWGGTTGPSLNGIADTAVRRATASGLGSPEAYIANSLRHPNRYIVPGYSSNVMPQFGASRDVPGTIDGAGYTWLPDEDLIPIVAYLCTQTVAPESPCGDIDAITEAVAAQQ